MLRPQRVLDLLNKWKNDVEQLLSDEHVPPEKAETLESLKQEMLYRRENSIRNQIYHLVLSTLQQNKDAKAEQQAKRAKDLYDLWSTLVHARKLPNGELSTALSEAKPLVNDILRIKYLADAQ